MFLLFLYLLLVFLSFEGIFCPTFLSLSLDVFHLLNAVLFHISPFCSILDFSNPIQSSIFCDILHTRSPQGLHLIFLLLHLIILPLYFYSEWQATYQPNFHFTFCLRTFLIATLTRFLQTVGD